MLKRDAGFSMIEILISMAILGGVGLGLVALSKQQKDTQKGMSGASELVRSMNKFREIMADPKTCELNFKGKSISGDSPGGNQKLKSLVDHSGKKILEVGDKFAKDNYELAGISLGVHDSNPNGTLVYLSYNKIATDSVRSKTTVKSFSIPTKITAGVITECVDYVAQTATGALIKSCLDVDPDKVGECEQNAANIVKQMKMLYCKGHPFLEYNDFTGKCLPLDANKSCPVGTFHKGYDGNGKLVCYAGP